MKPKRRGMIDQKRRFVLQDLQNECVWFFSYSQIKDFLLLIDFDEKDKDSQGKKEK